MTKAELVETIFEQGDVSETRAGTERAVCAVLASIARGLKTRRKVQIVGFGAFSVRKRKSRVGRNPQTGERLQIAASRTVSFKPAEKLRAEI